MTISSNFFQTVTEALETLDVPYFITGSMASAWYGEPRLTLDIDIVVIIAGDKIEAICGKFPAPEYYCSEVAVRQAVLSRRQFNVIQTTTGWKVDFMVSKNSEFDKSRFERRQRHNWSGVVEAWFSSPEDVIVKKLDFFREGGSEKHLRDIAGVLKVQADRIDETYIETWIAKLNLQPEWKLVKDQLNKPNRS